MKANLEAIMRRALSLSLREYELANLRQFPFLSSLHLLVELYFLSIKENPMTRMFYKIVLAGAFMLLSLISLAVNAQCTPGRLLLQGPPLLTLDPSTPIGTKLWEGSINSAGATGKCPAPFSTTGIPLSLYGKGVDVNKIYPSGVSGIGYKVRFNFPQACSYEYWPVNCRNIYGGETRMAPHTVELVLVRTQGDFSEGGEWGGLFASWGFAENVWMEYYWSPPLIIKPTRPTCKIESPSLSIPLGSVSRNVFTGLGSSSEMKPVNIRLSCSQGSQNGGTAVRVTLTDGTNPANLSRALSLTRGSTATGVSIQILKDSTVLGYGPASTANGNVNQWYAGIAYGGTFNIPLTARYVQSGPNVTAGSANGVATFTMNYQ